MYGEAAYIYHIVFLISSMTWFQIFFCNYPLTISIFLHRIKKQWDNI